MKGTNSGGRAAAVNGTPPFSPTETHAQDGEGCCGAPCVVCGAQVHFCGHQTLEIWGRALMSRETFPRQRAWGQLFITSEAPSPSSSRTLLTINGLLQKVQLRNHQTEEMHRPK